MSVLIGQEKEKRAAYADVVVAEIADDARYQIMRASRFVISLGCWMLMAASVVMAFCTPWLWSVWRNVPLSEVSWWRWPSVAHPLLAFAACVTGVAVFLALFVAIATPYRYETNKPGLNVRTCGRCGVQGPDHWTCGTCKGFRTAKIFTSLIWLAGAALTAITLTFDAMLFMAGFKSMGK